MPIPLGAFLGATAAGIGADLFSAGRANKRMIEFWHMQNEYNHPKAQMERLKEAGLNPNLVYGEGVSGATGQAGEVGTPARAKVDPVNEILKYQQVERGDMQLEILEEERRGKMLENNMTVSELFRRDIEDANYGDMYQTQFQAKQQVLKKAAAEAGLKEQELQLIMTTRDARVQQIINNATASRFKMDNEQKLGVLRDLEAQLKQSTIDFFTSNQIVNIITKLLGVR